MRATLICMLMIAGPAFAKDTVTRTGKLDLELVKHGDQYELRDDAYSITFPGEPTLQETSFSFDGELFPGVNGVLATPAGVVGIIVKPMPEHWTGSSAKALDSTRDGGLKGANAKLKKQTPTTLAGLAGRHVSALATENGQVVYLEEEMLWDVDHRTVIVVMTVGAVPRRTATQRAFVASFAVRRDARGPLDLPAPAEGVATKAGTSGFELIRHETSYTVGDGKVEATFPGRPYARSYATPPISLVVLGLNRGEVEALGLTVLSVPDGQEFDAAKGIAGTRDGYLKLFTKPKHKLSKAKLGGLDGERIELSGTHFGVKAVGQILIAWDAKHRRLYSAVATTAGKKLPASAQTFFDSIAIETAR